MKLFLFAAGLVLFSTTACNVVERRFLSTNCIFGSPETVAIQTLRTIHGAQAQFLEMKGRFATLQELADSSLIAPRYALKQPTSGYVFSSVKAGVAGVDRYCVRATPAEAQQHKRYFNIVEDGEVRVHETPVDDTQACGNGQLMQ